MDRHPVLRRDPTPPVAAAARGTGVLTGASPGPAGDVRGDVSVGAHPDRLEVVRTRGPRRAARPVPTGPRHRAPLGPRRLPRPDGGLLLLTGAAVVTLLLVLGVPLPAPLAGPALLVTLAVLGLPVVHLLRVPTPDPLARLVLATATGLVLVTGLFRLAGAAGLRPAGPVVALAGLALLTAAVLARRRLEHRPHGRRPRGRPPGTVLPRLPLLALPALAWLDVLGGVEHPGWLRVAVLTAAVVLLGRLTLRRGGRTDRLGVATTVHAVAVAVLTPLPAGTAATGVAPWTSGLARAWSSSPGAVEQVALPVVTSLVVVGAWLIAERVVGPRRAPVVAVLALTALLAAPPGAGDLAVTAAVLLVVTRAPAPRPGLAGRRLLVLLLGTGALLAAPGAAVFGAQVCLAALAAALLGPARRRAGTVLTLPLAVGFAAAVWAAAALGLRSPVAAGSVPALTTALAVLVVGLAAVGLLAVLARRVPRAPTDAEFLALATAGLLVQVLTALGAGPAGPPEPHVLLVLSVPAVLGVAAGWGLLAGGLGLVLDRVPSHWLRSGTRATRGHRRTPGRLLRTALVALVLLALAYARRAFG